MEPIKLTPEQIASGDYPKGVPIIVEVSGGAHGGSTAGQA